MDGGIEDVGRFPPDDAAVQFDRLLGLTRLIPTAVVRDVLRDTDRNNPRACVLSHEVTTWLLVAMGVLTDLPIAWGLRRHIRAGMLVLADREFFSCPLWEAYLGRGAQLLWRGKTNFVLEPSEVLSDGSYLTKIYPRPRDRVVDRRGIVVRVIKYNIDDPQRAGHRQVHILLTSLSDAEAYPAVDLILCYHQRWEHELMYDEQKTHHDPVRPGKPAQLRSGTPAGIVQELYALSFGHFVTQALRVEAARAEALDPDCLSFIGTLRILRCRLPECAEGLILE